LKKHKSEELPEQEQFFSSSTNIKTPPIISLHQSIKPTIKMSGTYKPTEHGGLKEDGTPDQRVGTGREFQVSFFNDAS
jgi:hypothetical protein